MDVRDLKQRTDCRELLAADLGAPARRAGEAWQWRCVFHPDRTPSLTAWPDGWRCFGCGRSGDAFTWLKERRGLSFREAVQVLGGEVPAPTPPVQAKDLREPPPPAWQEAAARFVQEAHACLLSDKGAKARAWLAARGIPEEVLPTWRLGLNPADVRTKWGTADVFLPRGIVIPAVVGGVPWGVKVRRPAGEPKYMFAKGSRPALYGGDLLRGHANLVLTEGEFDCILVHRLIGDRADVATFGSASDRDVRPWLPVLVRYNRLWLGFDRDEAGEKARDRWLALTRRARALTVPVGKDWTDAWKVMGDDGLRGYLLSALGLLQPGDPLPDRCTQCGAEVWAFDPGGVALCERHARASGYPWLEEGVSPRCKGCAHRKDPPEYVNGVAILCTAPCPKETDGDA